MPFQVIKSEKLFWNNPSERMSGISAVRSIGIIAFVAIVSDESGLFDVATVLALTTFLGTIAFAYYIEQRGTR